MSEQDPLFGEDDSDEVDDLEEKIEDLQEQVYKATNTTTEQYINFVEKDDGTKSLKVTTQITRWFPMKYVKKAMQNPSGGDQN